jgi:hypothetical protein
MNIIPGIKFIKTKNCLKIFILKELPVIVAIKKRKLFKMIKVQILCLKREIVFRKSNSLKQRIISKF